MRVAVDARNLQGRPLDGIGRVLAETLPRLGGDIDVTRLYDARRGPDDGDGVTLRSRLPTGTAWLQGPVASWLADFEGVFHCPFYALPYRWSGPTVVSLWDLTFESHPEWLPAHKRLAFRLQARHAARTATRIIVSSAVVRDDVRARYGVDDRRIISAPLAAGSAFHPRPVAELAAVRDRLRVRTPYLVAFGGAARRRLDLAAEAWRRAGGPATCTLVIVGGGPSVPGATRVGSLDDEELAALIAGATALLYPTAYEGFGLPAVEAQASGTPVICARVGALPEVLGDHAAWVEEPSADAFAHQIQALVADEARCAAIAAGGLAWQRSRLGWAAAAGAFVRAYTEAMEE